ncbi:hypothetical protein A0H81_01134 [Grifola frondosa]|uniref:Uncharacterized protein n=1 Tax=Grifola frondosa TaxID=5627 RepID=A0A1C7MSH4_GRIFR|nr:hypothetical protein A0H81_01134 [Grifola frondosa]
MPPEPSPGKKNPITQSAVIADRHSSYNLRLNHFQWTPQSYPALFTDAGQPISLQAPNTGFKSISLTTRPLLSIDAATSLSSQPLSLHSYGISPVLDQQAFIQALQAANNPVLSTPNPLASTLARDAIMASAYYIYDYPNHPYPGLTSVPLSTPPPASHTLEHSYRSRLLPLLLALRSFHPHYLPILLLLACTYHVLGDYESSLAISCEMLQIDSNYAEAMCNIGTTMKVLGHPGKAYEWWWKALQIRPMYWDAMDSILGMNFALARSVTDDSRRFGFYKQALGICHRNFTASKGSSSPAVELVIRAPSPFPEDERYSMRELLVSACTAGHLMCADGPILCELVQTLEHVSGIRVADPEFNLLYVVRASRNTLLDALLRRGGGVLPIPLLMPEEVMRLPMILFPASKGVLPSICTRAAPTAKLELPPRLCGSAQTR